MGWDIKSMGVDRLPMPGLAEQIAGLGREKGLRVTTDTDLRLMLETLAEGSFVRVPLMLALGEILGEIFRHDRDLAAEATDEETNDGTTPTFLNED